MVNICLLFVQGSTSYFGLHMKIHFIINYFDHCNCQLFPQFVVIQYYNASNMAKTYYVKSKIERIKFNQKTFFICESGFIREFAFIIEFTFQIRLAKILSVKAVTVIFLLIFLREFSATVVESIYFTFTFV